MTPPSNPNVYLHNQVWVIEEKPLTPRRYSNDSNESYSDEEFVRVRLPKKNDGELFAIADQNLGAYKIRVMCADGKGRLGRIPGKIKKRMWIREGDLLIVKPWDFQDDKANILYRYTKTQASYLSRKRMLPEILDVF